MTAHRERPLPCRAHEVRAILAGTKSQTRRLIRGATGAFWDHAGWTPVVEGGRIARWVGVDHGGQVGAGAPAPACPFGAVGDRLWLRETWKWGEYSCDDEPQDDDHECDAHCGQKYVYYRATPRVGYRAVPDQARIRYLDDASPLPEWYETGWKPSIHMPRWASRLTLEVTDVRVERLQSITDADARAEGVDPAEWSLDCSSTPPTHHFRALWDSLNKRPGTRWDDSPWCWAISFRRVGQGAL